MIRNFGIELPNGVCRDSGSKKPYPSASFTFRTYFIIFIFFEVTFTRPQVSADDGEGEIFSSKL